MSFLQIDGLTKRYERRGTEVHALENVNLEAAFGEFVCVLGVSGCGKSTLLQLLGGLEEPSSGEIRIDGSRVMGPHLDSSIVFQEHGLFPWMNVRTNVAFNLKARGVARAERRERSAQLIDLVGLSAFADKFPHELSGGMRQRVGIARALSTDPKLMLMDEPFGALDAQTRLVMQQELLRVWQASPRTIVFITHGIDEAVFLADRIVVMTPRPGRVRRVFNIDLPRPRDPLSPAFNAHVQGVFGEISDDIRLVAAS
jgi:NitT/TauT family transport system ATP-binding protein